MSKVKLSILFIVALAMTAALAAPDRVYIYTADWCNHRIVRVAVSYTHLRAHET